MPLSSLVNLIVPDIWGVSIWALFITIQPLHTSLVYVYFLLEQRALNGSKINVINSVLRLNHARIYDNLP